MRKRKKKTNERNVSEVIIATRLAENWSLIIYLMNKRDFFKQRVNPEDNYLTTPINMRPIYDLHKKKHKKAKKHKKKTKKTYSDDEMEEQPRMTDKQKQQILLTKELEGEI